MLFAAIGLGFTFVGQSSDEAKSIFNSALINSDGAKLYSILDPAELKTTSAKACSQFLALVTKPRIPLIGSYDQTRTKFLPITDSKSPMTMRFKQTGGASIIVQDKRKYAFEPTVVWVGKKVKVSTGFATIAFWASHQDKSTKSARGLVNRAMASHNMVKSWVPQFLKMGIKGSIDPEVGKYLTWSQIMDSSQKEIDKLKSGS